MKLMPIDTTIIVLGSNLSGKIVGYSSFYDQTYYIIELDEGFYNPERNVYVSKLVAHPDNVQAKE